MEEFHENAYILKWFDKPFTAVLFKMLMITIISCTTFMLKFIIGIHFYACYLQNPSISVPFGSLFIICLLFTDDCAF